MPGPLTGSARPGGPRPRPPRCPQMCPPSRSCHPRRPLCTPVTSPPSPLSPAGAPVTFPAKLRARAPVTFPAEFRARAPATPPALLRARPPVMFRATFLATNRAIVPPLLAHHHVKNLNMLPCQPGGQKVFCSYILWRVHLRVGEIALNLFESWETDTLVESLSWSIH